MTINVADTKDPKVFLIQKRTKILGVPWTRNLFKVRAESSEEIINEILSIFSGDPRFVAVDLRKK